jgi:hypothetical protein
LFGKTNLAKSYPLHHKGETMNTRSLFLSAGIAGLIIGVLSGIPFVNIVNCLLCTWVWAGGILAVYLYQRNEPTALMVKPEQGALLGAIAGVIGAIVVTILGAIIGGAGNAALISMIQDNPQLQEQFGDYLGQLAVQGGFSLLGLMCNSVIYAAFGAIGGLIGAAVLKPKASPPPPAM